MSLTRRSFSHGLLATPLAAAASAQTSADFYRGKTVTIVCGFNAGGGVDLGTRLIADHLGRFIPGNPAFIVQNMQGANGLIAANFLYAKSAADGLTLAVPGRDWLLKPALRFSNARFDAEKFGFVGSTGGTNFVFWARKDQGSPTAQSLKVRDAPLLVGALPGVNATSIVPKQLARLGYKLQTIAGYDNTPRILLAIEQKEVSAIYTPESTFGRRRDMIDSGLLVPLFQSIPNIPGVPTAEDLVSAAEKPVMRLAHGHTGLGMPLVSPPNVAGEKLAILQQAFLEMAASPAFQERARLIDEPTGNPLSGKQVEDGVLQILASITPAAVDDYLRLGEQ